MTTLTQLDYSIFEALNFDGGLFLRCVFLLNHFRHNKPPLVFKSYFLFLCEYIIHLESDFVNEYFVK